MKIASVWSQPCSSIIYGKGENTSGNVLRSTARFGAHRRRTKRSRICALHATSPKEKVPSQIELKGENALRQTFVIWGVEKRVSCAIGTSISPFLCQQRSGPKCPFGVDRQAGIGSKTRRRRLELRNLNSRGNRSLVC